MLNVYEQIDRNRRRSSMIIVLFIIFVTLSSWGISQAMDGSGIEIIIALFFAVIITLFSYFQGDKMALALASLYRCRES